MSGRWLKGPHLTATTRASWRTGDGSRDACWAAGMDAICETRERADEHEGYPQELATKPTPIWYGASCASTPERPRARCRRESALLLTKSMRAGWKDRNCGTRYCGSACQVQHWGMTCSARSWSRSFYRRGAVKAREMRQGSDLDEGRVLDYVQETSGTVSGHRDGAVAGRRGGRRGHPGKLTSRYTCGLWRSACYAGWACWKTYVGENHTSEVKVMNMAAGGLWNRSAEARRSRLYSEGLLAIRSNLANCEARREEALPIYHGWRSAVLNYIQALVLPPLVAGNPKTRAGSRLGAQLPEITLGAPHGDAPPSMNSCQNRRPRSARRLRHNAGQPRRRRNASVRSA